VNPIVHIEHTNVSFKFTPPARILTSLPTAYALLIVADAQDNSGGVAIQSARFKRCGATV